MGECVNTGWFASLMSRAGRLPYLRLLIIFRTDALLDREVANDTNHTHGGRIMRPIWRGVLLLALTPFIVGCMTATDWEPPQEILNLQEVGRLRRQAEETAQTHPPVRARDAEGLPAATVPGTFEGIWRYVRDDRNYIQDVILHIRADGFFYQVFARTEHGDLYVFAARGPIVEDEHGRLYLPAEEVRQFDPNYNSAGEWDSPPQRELAELDFVRWPVALHPDPNGSGNLLFFQVRPEEVELFRIRPFTPEQGDERFTDEDHLIWK